MSNNSYHIQDNSELLSDTREFWNNHVHDWKIAKSPAGTKDFFLEIEEYRFEKLEYLAKIVDFAGYPGKTVLDVGCGVGNDLSRFAKGGSIVTGIDIAPHSIELAKSNFQQRELRGEFHVMNGESMEFPSNSFDLVYCHTVLHFTPDPEQMIAEIHRVLKPDGQAIIMTVNRYSWLNVLNKFANIEIDHLDAPVFRKFTINEFKKLLSAFKEVNIIPERFPVRTKVHSGLKARLFNTVFVDIFNKIPRSFTRKTGHHLMAFCRKMKLDSAGS